MVDTIKITTTRVAESRLEKTDLKKLPFGMVYPNHKFCFFNWWDLWFFLHESLSTKKK